MPTPKRKRPAVTIMLSPMEDPSPMVGMLSTISTVPSSMIGRVPKRATRGPELRIPAIDPTERPSSTSPTSAVEASRRSRIAGVLVTHEEILSPGTKNRAKSARRRRRASSITGLILTWTNVHTRGA
jgi:hypothetical protein